FSSCSSNEGPFLGPDGRKIKPHPPHPPRPPPQPTPPPRPRTTTPPPPTPAPTGTPPPSTPPCTSDTPRTCPPHQPSPAPPPEAIAAVRAACAGRDYQVRVFPTKYPSGGEKQLIQILTGVEVPSGGLPADIGILCQNVGTCVAIHDAVLLGKPLISRITTLTGEALARPGNVEALIGTPVGELLSLAGLDQNKLNRLIMGGPMMGFTLPSLDVPLIKTSNCLLASTAAELPTPAPAMPCI